MEYQAALYFTAFMLIVTWFIGVAVGFTLLPAVFLGLNLYPSLTVTSRRLRDAGFSQKLMWLFLVPVIGWLILLIKAFGAVSDKTVKPQSIIDPDEIRALTQKGHGVGKIM